jgi:hypothetical protein
MEQNISILKQRILMFAEYKGLSKRKIYTETGISNGILDKKGGLSEDSILKFLSTYREIDPVWFVSGHGTMIRTEQPGTNNISAEDAINYNNCPHCKEKERIIENQNQRILELKDTIDILKVQTNIKSKRHSA